MTARTAKPQTEYITRKEAAALLNVGERTIDRYVRVGLLKTFRPRVIRGQGGGAGVVEAGRR